MEPQKFNRLLRKIKYDKRAMEKIYEEFYPKIVIHLHRRFGNLLNPNDVAHDVFVSLLSKEFTTPIEYPIAWLFTLADNRAKDILKLRHDEIALSEFLNAPFNIDSTILKEDLKNALKQLDPVSQQILYLHFWEGYSYKEIANELKTSHGNVRIKACRAYKFLKTIL